MMLVALIILWSALALLFGTAAMAVRAASLTRLTELMQRRRREKLLHRFFRMKRHYARLTLVFQFLVLVLLVMTVYAGLPEAWTGYRRPALTFALCLAWVLLFGVGIPVAWARYRGDAFLAAVLPLLDKVRLAGHPVLVALDAIDEVVRRLAGAPPESQEQSEQIELEIMDAVSHGETSGAVDPAEKAMIRSVMDLDEISAGEIMTPRTDMVAIDVGADYEQVRRLILSDGHSRIPVYEGSADHIVGVLYAKDLLAVNDPVDFELRKTMRDVTFVPETKDLASLLREFQVERVHIAIVLDEYGGTAGLITFEDILEELVGEITDEHEAPPTPPIRRIDPRTTEIDARLRVDEINEELGLKLPEDEAYDTIGGFVLSRLGRIPKTGDSVVEGDVRIDIVEARERSIRRLRIRILDAVHEE
ncbi:MAG: hemolysin family protein [Phycisphaerae bacterium]